MAATKKITNRALSVLLLAALLVLTAVAATTQEREKRIPQIRARGVLLVGTTGDYRPMSFLDPDSGEYWGFDIELAKDLADALGVDIKPNTLTMRLNVTAGRLFNEHGIRYQNKHGHGARQIILRYAPKDNPV